MTIGRMPNNLQAPINRKINTLTDEETQKNPLAAHYIKPSDMPLNTIRLYCDLLWSPLMMGKFEVKFSKLIFILCVSF